MALKGPDDAEARRLYAEYRRALLVVRRAEEIAFQLTAKRTGKRRGAAEESPSHAATISCRESPDNLQRSVGFNRMMDEKAREQQEGTHGASNVDNSWRDPG